jgi:hypothetical protein
MLDIFRVAAKLGGFSKGAQVHELSEQNASYFSNVKTGGTFSNHC